VVDVEGAPRARVWHWLAGDQAHAVEGKKADLRLPRTGAKTLLEVVSLVVLARDHCAWTWHTPVTVAVCESGPGVAAVFAEFTWRMLGPGDFQFAAKPSRTSGVRFERFVWDFGDGTRQQTRKPIISHRFVGQPEPWRLVKLEVQASLGRARVARVVVDRSVRE